MGVCCSQPQQSGVNLEKLEIEWNQDPRIKTGCEEVTKSIKSVSDLTKSVEQLITQINQEFEQLKTLFKDNQGVLKFLQSLEDTIQAIQTDMSALKRSVKTTQSESKSIQDYNPNTGVKSIRTLLDDDEVDGPDVTQRIDLNDVDQNISRLNGMKENLNKISESLQSFKDKLESESQSIKDLDDVKELKELVNKLSEVGAQFQDKLVRCETEISELLELAREVADANINYIKEEELNIQEDHINLLSAFNKLNETFLQLIKQQEETKANVDAQLQDDQAIKSGAFKETLAQVIKEQEQSQENNNQIDVFQDLLQKARIARKDFKIIQIQQIILSELDQLVNEGKANTEQQQLIEALKQEVNALDLTDVETKASYKHLANLVNEENQLMVQLDEIKQTVDQKHLQEAFNRFKNTIEEFRIECNNLDKLGAVFDKSVLYSNKMQHVRHIQTQMDISLQQLENKIVEGLIAGLENLTSEQFQELETMYKPIEQAFKNNRINFGDFSIPSVQLELKQSLDDLKGEEHIGKLNGQNLPEGGEQLLQNIIDDISNMEAQLEKYSAIVSSASSYSYGKLIEPCILHDDFQREIKNLSKQISDLVDGQITQALFGALENIKIELAAMNSVIDLKSLVKQVEKFDSKYYEPETLQIYQERSNLISAQHADINQQVTDLTASLRQAREKETVTEISKDIEATHQAYVQLERDINQTREDLGDFKIADVQVFLQLNLSKLQAEIDQILAFEIVHNNLNERIDALQVHHKSLQSDMSKRDNRSACLNTENQTFANLVTVSEMQFEHAEELDRLTKEATELVEIIPTYGKDEALDAHINRLAELREKVDQYEDFKAKFIVSGSLNVEQDDYDMVTETEQKLNEVLTQSDKGIDQVQQIVYSGKKDDHDMESLHAHCEQQLTELETVIEEEFKKAIARINLIQSENNENITVLKTFMLEDVDPKCDEEHEFNESSHVKTTTEDLKLKMDDVTDHLLNADQLQLVTHVVDEQNRHSHLLLELFARSYTLYSEMIHQEFEGFYNECEQEILSLLEQKDAGKFSQASCDQLNVLIENLDKFEPEDFQQKLQEVNWYSIWTQNRDPVQQKMMLETLMGNADMFVSITEKLSILSQQIMEFGQNNSMKVVIKKKKLKAKLQRKDTKVDDLFFEYANKKYPNLEARKIRDGFYQIGNKKVHVIEKNNKVLVRIGGGFAKMEQFFDNLQIKEQETRLQNLAALESKSTQNKSEKKKKSQAVKINAVVDLQSDNDIEEPQQQENSDVQSNENANDQEQN